MLDACTPEGELKRVIVSRASGKRIRMPFRHTNDDVDSLKKFIVRPVKHHGEMDLYLTKQNNSVARQASS